MNDDIILCDAKTKILDKHPLCYFELSQRVLSQKASIPASLERQRASQECAKIDSSAVLPK